MAALLPLLLLLLALTGYDVTGQITPADQSDRVANLERMTSQLARQLMLQQLYTEEATRSGGDSGLKQIRLRNDGSKPYFTESFAYKSVAALHDHSDHERTCGIGEFIAVLNGVEFRTRHNDYKLVMPSTTSGEYHATEVIEFPPVPPEVLEKVTVEEQIVELREWFKAWQDGDPSVRDYRQYFKPLLCYLEGGWTTSGSLEEPFDSDRHQLDADSWFDLQEKIRFTSYTGDKNLDENFAYLPTTIMNVTDGVPVFGQWNYRILCHPIQGGVELSELKPIDNLANRMAMGKKFDAYVNSRSARFSLDPSTSDEHYTWSRLDEVMYQIPGQDNYQASLNGSVFGHSKVTPDTEAPLNAGFYHRWFKILRKDAMGQRVLHRGFADRNLFVAETSQPHVAAMSIPYCRSRKEKRQGTCSTLMKRVTYAVPLEVVFLTPLQAWNPYDLQYKGDAKSPLGMTVTVGRRNGQLTASRAFNGTNSKEYYMTPAEFFDGREVDKGSADTTRNGVGVLDKNGNVHAMTASGVRIFLPNIPGVGVTRTRYPIMPMFSEGAAVWKEMEALRDVVMNMQAYMDMFLSPPDVAEASRDAQASSHLDVRTAVAGEQASMNGRRRASSEGQASHIVLETSPSTYGGNSHTHTIGVNRFDYFKLTRRDKVVPFKTSVTDGHSHTVKVDYDEHSNKFLILLCDSKPECSDGHGAELIEKVVIP